MDGASLVAQLLKSPPAMRETGVRSLGWEDPLEKGIGYPEQPQYSGLENPMDSPWGRKESDMTERLSPSQVAQWERICLPLKELDRGACWAAVYGVTQNRTRLKRLSSSSSRRQGYDPWVGKIPWRRKWQPTPVFLPGKSHGLRRLLGCGPQCCKESDTTEHVHMHTHTCTHAHTYTHARVCTHTHGSGQVSGHWEWHGKGSELGGRNVYSGVREETNLSEAENPCLQDNKSNAEKVD